MVAAWLSSKMGVLRRKSYFSLHWRLFTTLQGSVAKISYRLKLQRKYWYQYNIISFRGVWEKITQNYWLQLGHSLHDHSKSFCCRSKAVMYFVLKQGKIQQQKYKRSSLSLFVVPMNVSSWLTLEMKFIASRFIRRFQLLRISYSQVPM